MWLNALPPGSQVSEEEESQIIRTGGHKELRIGPISKLIKTEVRDVKNDTEVEMPLTPAPMQKPLGLIESTVRFLPDYDDDYLTTGCSKLDKFLNGGIPCFGLTEFCGQSASAKTQLCLQLALHAHLPKELGGLDGGTVYLTTESCFSTKRLAELSEHFSLAYGISSQDNPMNENIMVEVVSDRNCLFWCLQVRIPSLIRKFQNRGGIRLIILDSIAAIFRDFDKKNGYKRVQDLRAVGTMLNNIGREQKAAIISVNQATTCFSTHSTIAALGLAWTNMITTRIELSRMTLWEKTKEGFVEKDVRRLKVLFAPHIRTGTIDIELSSKGICASGQPVYPNPS